MIKEPEKQEMHNVIAYHRLPDAVSSLEEWLPHPANPLEVFLFSMAAQRMDQHFGQSGSAVPTASSPSCLWMSDRTAGSMIS